MSFYGTSGPRDAKIMIIGEAWGADEMREQQPFVGRSGKELTNMLSEAGINRDDCFLTNVVSKKPVGNKFEQFLVRNADAKKAGMLPFRGLYASDDLISAYDTLMFQIEQVKPEVIIAAGNYALWAVTDECVNYSGAKGYKVPSGIMKWRGSQIYTNTGVKCVPIVHPAAIMRAWYLRYPTVHDLRVRVARHMNSTRWMKPDWDFTIRPTFEQACGKLHLILKMLELGPTWLSVDIETRAGQIACIGIAWSKIHAISIPIACVERPDGYWSVEHEFRIQALLRRVFSHENFRGIGQNFKYDVEYLMDQLFSRPPCHFDTMLAQHLCYPGTPKGLDYLSSMYCYYHRYWKDDGKEWDKHMDEDMLWIYNCEDCVRTFEAKEELEGVIAHMGKGELMEERMALHDLSLDMTIKGIRVDKKYKDKLAVELMDEMAKREAKLLELVPESIMPINPKAKPWYRSPKQLAELFYDVLGVRPVIDRASGSRTTKDEALDKIIVREPLLTPICELLKEYRSLGVYLNTFVLTQLESDGYMRTSFNVGGTETYRFSSSKNAFGRGANMQNIPKGDED